MISATAIKDLKTPSLVIREMKEADARDLAGFMTQPRYQRYIVQRLMQESDVIGFVRRQVNAQNDVRRKHFHLVAEERFSCEVVGDGFIINKGDGVFEIGWGLHPALWRAGFGTEIGRALLALAFERLRAQRVTCKVMKPNIGSAALARKIGMRKVKPASDAPIDDILHFDLSAEAYYDLPY